MLYERALSVHCAREGLCHACGHAKESAWTSQKVKAEECYTLCRFCHLGKHSIVPAVLRRDKFQCVDCGKKPEAWSNERRPASGPGIAYSCVPCHRGPRIG